MKTSMVMALAAPLLAAAQRPAYGEYARRGFGPGGMRFGMGMGGFGCGYDDGDSCGPWGGDGCASSCFSSYWETATPTPTAFCDTGSELHGCIEAACTQDADKMASYSSRSSSLCSAYSSCDSTGTYTYSYMTPDGNWGGHRGTHTWPTGEVVVTGCPWNGDGWGFPFWGGLGYGDNFWDSMGPGWTHATITTTVTSDSTSAVVTLEKAESGDLSTFRTLGAEAAATGSDGAAETPSAADGNLKEIKVMGAALGAVVAVAGLL